MDVVFAEAADGGAGAAPLASPWLGDGADVSQVEHAAALLRGAQRPVIMAGTGLYWGRGENELAALAEALRSELADAEDEIHALRRVFGEYRDRG